MNIIIDKRISSRLNDGINMLLNLDDATFDIIISKLGNIDEHENINFFYTDDLCENPEGKIQIGLEQNFDEEGNRIGRYYYGAIKITLYEILEALDKKQNTILSDSKQFERIKRLLEVRGIEGFKKSFNAREAGNITAEKALEIVAKDDVFEKFLDYDSNKDYFSCNGEAVDIREYLKCLGKIFGREDKKGNLHEVEAIYKDFYIPEIEKYKEKYKQIYEKFYLDRHLHPEYELKTFYAANHFKYRTIEEDSDWEANKELKEAVLGDMPEDLTAEEKAMYVYCKMCYLLTYDDGYFYRKQSGDDTYNGKMIKEHLKSIKPGSKITCFDFARLYPKIVNGLDDNLRAETIAEGLAVSGHYLTGFYTDKVSTLMEAINVKVSTNDLMKARNSIKFGGLDIISDRQGLLDQAMEKVIPLVTGKNARTLEDYVAELRSLKTEEVPNNLKLKIESFIEIMKQKGIYGNEAIQELTAFYHVKFFGEFLHRAYIGRKEEKDGKISYKRMVLLRSMKKYKETPEESELYLLDSETLNLDVCSEEEIINRFNAGEFVYESEDHKMPGVNLEDR